MRPFDPREEDASISAFIAVIATALVMVAGMAYDGGQILAAYAEARDLAANAARAGAQRVDIDELRATGQPALDRALVSESTQHYLDDVGADALATTEVSGSSVTVSVSLRQPMVILPLPDRTVVATESADAVTTEESVD